MTGAIVPAVLTTGLVGLLASIILVVVSKVFAVQEDPRVAEVLELLPNANCGGCGFAGCAAFAEALVKTGDTSLKCPVASSEAMEAIGALLGLELSTDAPPVAALKCHATNEEARQLALYAGIQDCHAATLLFPDASTRACRFGCIGLGSCVRACPFDAMRIDEGGIVEIDEAKCTGCGNCVLACPKDLLVLVPRGERVFVACNSTDKGGPTKKACSVGCIGCKQCVKACEHDAVHVTNNLAVIDPDACTNCMACVKVCPTGCILTWHLDAGLVEDAEAELDPAA